MGRVGDEKQYNDEETFYHRRSKVHLLLSMRDPRIAFVHTAVKTEFTPVRRYQAELAIAAQAQGIILVV